MSSNSSKKDTCSEIEIPAQEGDICWFMAMFVAMFYSQGSKKLLMDASKDWDKSDNLFFNLNNILKSKNYNYAQHENNFFKEILLDLKYNFNSKSFPYDPRYNSGFLSEIYIGKLYNLLKIDSIIFEYNPIMNWLTYSTYNVEFNDIISWKFDEKGNTEIIGKGYKSKFEEIMKVYKKNPPPPILIVNVRVINIYKNKKFKYFKELYLNSASAKNIDIKDEENIKSLKEKIEYMGKKYTLDYIILSNWNIADKAGSPPIIDGIDDSYATADSHAIAGITCKNKRYIYNSWEREVSNHYIPYACKLMEHDWIKNQNFCLNVKNCSPTHIQIENIEKFQNEELCFNFQEGDRLLIYICDDVRSSQLQSRSLYERRSSYEPSFIRWRSKSLPEPEPRSSLLSSSPLFNFILTTMTITVNIIEPFLYKNMKKLNIISIEDLEETEYQFEKLIIIILSLFQKLLNEKIDKKKFQNKLENKLTNELEKNNNLSFFSRNTIMSLTTISDNVKIYINNIIAKYNDTNQSIIIPQIRKNSKLYKNFNELFSKFCLLLFILILYTRVVGLTEEEIFLMNNLTPSSRSRRSILLGGKQVKKQKETPKKKPKNKA